MGADDDGYSLFSDDSDVGGDLIKKPQGEVSRPHSGGYNLADVLAQSGWKPDQFARLRVKTSLTSVDRTDIYE